MTKEERQKYYDLADKKWGKVAQIDQCIEEMAELIVALNKYKRKSLYNEYQNMDKIEDDVALEIADVTMCVEQMIGYFGEEKVQSHLDTQMQKFIKQINN